MKTKQALTALDKAIALIGTPLPGKEEHEWTALEYATRTKMSQGGAKDLLAQQVRKGILKSRQGVIAGKRMNVYSLAD
jgi:hypothetical protein